ncbi:MAG TPA: FKBP-type peptidyl-prolyl cis-trans isomerase [Terriglobales bacterium]|nr:FKBP-type peptidyl-prolyl cis-trans isomerase [Terriglobales bacterium]
MTKYAMAAVIVLVFAIVGFMMAQTAPAKKTPATPNTKAPTKVTGDGVKTDSGLQYWDIRLGNGETAKEGSRVRVHYTGWLTNGKKFDSSVDAGTPFDFRIGNGEVIKGWEEGVTGMRVGGKRQLRIPPSLAYGADGTPDGTIPPNAMLIFDIHLLAIQ